MKKNKKIVLIIVAIVLVIGAVIGGKYVLDNKKEKEVLTSDATSTEKIKIMMDKKYEEAIKKVYKDARIDTTVEGDVTSRFIDFKNKKLNYQFYTNEKAKEGVIYMTVEVKDEYSLKEKNCKEMFSVSIYENNKYEYQMVLLSDLGETTTYEISKDFKEIKGREWQKSFTEDVIMEPMPEAELKTRFNKENQAAVLADAKKMNDELDKTVEKIVDIHYK